MNYKKIKKAIGYFLNKEKSNFLSFKIAEITLKGVKGIDRKSVDMDDAWLFYLTKNSEVFYDLGCNIGYISLLAAIQKTNKMIVAVDPNPEALAKTAQNLIINGFGYKAKFISAFIGDVDGEEVKFYTVGSGEAGSMYANHAETASAINSYYYVKKITIDTIVRETNTIPDLIKIDVEGAENLALKGAVETAKKQIAKIIVEMHALPELSMLDSANFVIKWCQENHYNPYYLHSKELLKDGETIATRGKCHLLLLPKNQEYPNYLKNINQRDKLPQSID
ncbi:FkbM family methyltransferase [Flavobacterium sp.]|uniref:FkbM family methyltransferase n=1 Tax=Flavobacterium sp. TaxID=239 RepID=UPI00374CA1E3